METSDVATSEFVPFGAAQREATASGVSWGAVMGGAFVAAALSLILLALGAGFGLSNVSPWAKPGSASAVGAIAIVWLIVTQLIASSMGGYLTGRLRTKWNAIHGDEVHFRDTANGFLAWAVALVVTVAFLTTAATSLAGVSMPTTDANAYYVDQLLRSDRPAAAADLEARAEAARILEHSLLRSGAADRDTASLAQIVSARTELGLGEAQTRVSNVMVDARQNADQMRRATAHFLLWLFVALLFGAFCASLAATIGGRQRDRVQRI